MTIKDFLKTVNNSARILVFWENGRFLGGTVDEISELVGDEHFKSVNAINGAISIQV